MNAQKRSYFGMEKKYYRVNKINNDLAVAHPNIAGFSFTIPGRIGI